MADTAPSLAVGDIATPLAQSLVVSCRTAVGASSPVQKGDIINITGAQNVTDLSFVAEVGLASAADTAVFGVAIDNAFGGSASAKWTIAVCIHGIVKVTATAAAIAKGAIVTAGGGSTGASLVITMASGIVSATTLATMLGYAITDFGSSDSGLIFILK